MDLEILNPIKELTIGSETVAIRELAWPDALAFLKKLAERAALFSTADGKLAITADKLAEVITSASDLSEWLVLKATGKDQTWLQQRSFSEGLNLLEAALSMNLRPDFFEKLKRIGLRFTGALGKTQPSSTSSSGKDTPVQT